MKPPIILGLTGSARSGKTTIAEHLRDAHGFRILSFADPLKKMLRTLDPMIGVEEEYEHPGFPEESISYPVHLSDFLEDDQWIPGVDEDRIKNDYPEYRRLLQVLGTDCIRALEPNFWVDRLWEQLDLELAEGNSVVIPDIRFPNEARVLDGWIVGHVKLINVYRPGAPATLTHASEEFAGHMGETTMFLNDGTVENLKSIVDGYMAAVTK